MNREVHDKIIIATIVSYLRSYCHLVVSQVNILSIIIRCRPCMLLTWFNGFSCVVQVAITDCDHAFFQLL